MLFKVLTVAVFAAVFAPIGAYSQSIAQIGGPAELPPTSYKGLQYVDSRGCVFMRVESSGTARWYPRVNAGRRPVCNQIKPGSIDVAADAPMVAPAPAPVFGRAPMPTIASRMMPEARVRPAPVVVAPVVVAPQVVAVRPAPYVDHAPVNSYERAATSGPAKGKIGCYTNAPVAEVVRLRNGGTAVMCTRGDGTTGGWRPPIYPAGSPPGVALRDPVQVTRGTVNAGRVTGYDAPVARGYAAAETQFAPPPGYKVAWKDDRLNPLRGVGTAQGQADQDRIWTRKTPARLVADVERKKAARSGVTISTMNAPVKVAKQGGGRVFVQVGTFGVASNASGAAARLRSAGLPVATSKLVKGGKVLQIVLAGPFGSAGEAQAGLAQARRAGFGDAFLR
jgi:hypothetical protein